MPTKKKSKTYTISTTVNGEFNWAAHSKSKAKVQAKFRELMIEHDDHPDGRQYTEARIKEAVKRGYFDDGSGYIIEITEDSVDSLDK